MLLILLCLCKFLFLEKVVGIIYHIFDLRIGMLLVENELVCLLQLRSQAIHFVEVVDLQNLQNEATRFLAHLNSYNMGIKLYKT